MRPSLPRFAASDGRVFGQLPWLIAWWEKLQTTLALQTSTVGVSTSFLEIFLSDLEFPWVSCRFFVRSLVIEWDQQKRSPRPHIWPPDHQMLWFAPCLHLEVLLGQLSLSVLDGRALWPVLVGSGWISDPVRQAHVIRLLTSNPTRGDCSHNKNVCACNAQLGVTRSRNKDRHHHHTLHTPSRIRNHHHTLHTPLPNS